MMLFGQTGKTAGQGNKGLRTQWAIKNASHARRIVCWVVREESGFVSFWKTPWIDLICVPEFSN